MPFEEMYMYFIDATGSYGSPVPIRSERELAACVKENVEKFYELRLVDSNDLCTMRIIDRRLVFPCAAGKENNKWNPAAEKFLPVSV